VAFLIVLFRILFLHTFLFQHHQDESGRSEVRDDGAHERVQLDEPSSVEDVGGGEVFSGEE